MKSNFIFCYVQIIYRFVNGHFAVALNVFIYVLENPYIMILYILKKGTYLQRVEFAVKMVTVKHSIFFFFFSSSVLL